MKILALNGSHRGTRGHTQVLLERLAEGARAVGGDFEIVVLADLQIKACRACQTC